MHLMLVDVDMNRLMVGCHRLPVNQSVLTAGRARGDTVRMSKRTCLLRPTKLHSIVQGMAVAAVLLMLQEPLRR